MFSFLSTNLHVNEPVEEEENIALAGIIIVTFLIGISIIFELVWILFLIIIMPIIFI